MTPKDREYKLIPVRERTFREIKIFVATSGRSSYDDFFQKEVLPFMRNKKRKDDYHGGFW